MNNQILLSIFFLLLLLSCNKNGEGVPKPGNQINTTHKPLIYLIDYIKENNHLIISWKFNARYGDFKSVHIKNSKGEEKAVANFPLEYLMLDDLISEKVIYLQVENDNGKFSELYSLNLDRDQQYDSLLEKEPIKSIAINKATAVPYFYKKGENSPFLLFGVNYIRLRGQQSRIDGDHSTFEADTPSTEKDYNPYQAETLFRILKSKGFNFVRVFITGRSMVNPGISGPVSLNEPVYGPYMDNVIDFLKRARKYGIYVYPTFGDGELPQNEWYRSKIDNPDLSHLRLYFPFVEAAVDLKAKYLQAFLSYIKQNDPDLIKTLFAIELQNEYALNANVWPFTQQSGQFDAYWNEKYDMSDVKSRQKLADDATILYQNKMVEAVHQFEPDLLVGEGFFALNAVGKDTKNSIGLYPGNFQDERYPPTFNVTVKSNIDFIDIHAYPNSNIISIKNQFDIIIGSMLENSTNLNDILAKKPVILGEFGAFYEFEKGSIAVTANRMAELANNAMTNGFCGWCFWTFDGFEQERLYNMMEENQEILNDVSHSIK